MMAVTRTKLGCTVTTTYGETTVPLGDLPAGTPIEHVTLECERPLDLRIVRPDRVKEWYQ